jgi:hypothetical protein
MRDVDCRPSQSHIGMPPSAWLSRRMFHGRGSSARLRRQPRRRRNAVVRVDCTTTALQSYRSGRLCLLHNRSWSAVGSLRSYTPRQGSGTLSYRGRAASGATPYFSKVGRVKHQKCEVGGVEVFLELHSTTQTLTTRTHTHPYEYTYANPTPMSTSEGLSTGKSVDSQRHQWRSSTGTSLTT